MLWGLDPSLLSFPLDHLRGVGKWKNSRCLSGRWKKVLHHTVDWFLKFMAFRLFFFVLLIPFIVVFQAYCPWRAGLSGRLQAHIGAFQTAKRQPV